MEPSYIYPSPAYRLRKTDLTATEKLVPVNGYDGALLWKKVSMDKTGQYIAAIADKSDGFIWISDDYGVTWSANGNNNNWTDVAVSGDANMFAAIAKSGILSVSADGKTWTPRTILNSYSQNWSSLCISQDGSKMLAVANDSLSHFIYYSNNTFGASWSPVTASVLGGDDSTPGQHKWAGVAMDSNLGVALALPIDAFVLPVIYNGQTNKWFSKGQFNNNWYKAAVSPDGLFVGAITSTNIIYLSINGSVITSKNPFGGGISGGFALSEFGDYVVAAKNGGKIYRSTDNANSFAEVNLCPTKAWTDVASDYSGENIALAASGDNIWICNFNGSAATFSNQNERNWAKIASSSDGKSLIAVDNGANVHGGYLHLSKDGGETWSELKESGDIVKPSFLSKWESVAMSDNGEYITAIETSGSIDKSTGFIWHSQNGGDNWERCAPLRVWTDVAMSGDGKKQFIVDTNSSSLKGYVWISDNYGLTWTAQTNVQAGQYLKKWKSISCSYDGSVLVATELENGNLFTSIDSGRTWVIQPGYDSANKAMKAEISADGSIIVIVTMDTSSLYSVAVRNFNKTANTLGSLESNVQFPMTTVKDICVSSNGSLIAVVTTTSGISSSIDYGKNWKYQFGSGIYWNLSRF